MRQGIAIFFIILMMSISCKEIIHFAAFKINQDYISAVFCINKDKPTMKCDGKCYLKKNLETSREERQSKPIPPPSEKSFVAYFEMGCNPPIPESASKSKTRFTYLNLFPSGLTREILHPPERWT
jgi:hypothetical protein